MFFVTLVGAVFAGGCPRTASPNKRIVCTSAAELLVQSVAAITCRTRVLALFSEYEFPSCGHLKQDDRSITKTYFAAWLEDDVMTGPSWYQTRKSFVQ